MTVDPGLLALLEANPGMSDRPAVFSKDGRQAQPGGRLPAAQGPIAPDLLAKTPGIRLTDILAVK